MISKSKILSHTRSSSLPSRSHPLIPQFNDHLHRLRAATAASDATSLPSLAENLTNLDNLHGCIGDLLLLRHTRRVFRRERGEKWAEQVLDGYLGLVDAWATAKDLLSHAREHVLRLLSLLRRRRRRDLSAFLASRKAARKSAQRTLRNITGLKHKPSAVALDRDAETIAVISMLKEAEAATLDLVESLLCSVAGARRLGGGWSLVSRLISSRNCSGQDRDRGRGRDRDDHKQHILEFCELDAALEKLVSLRRFDGGDGGGVSAQVDELRLQLTETEGSLGVLEEKVEALFKRLIRTRVSLLNMQSN
ncbi:uncharacterized protein LOC131020874 [Salvia miltiorrhiza]|uniref:uncharacterized protein LOC131020874 n=1 Tax=Salvia miltiorrhiza TaxID=226208 RepID=UPI0025AC74A2|nr:uncharacterized protein LOC131020874 [Salvia miltiorrhiza]